MEQLALMERPADATPAKEKTKKEAPNYTLTARDQQVLTWVGEMYSARLDVIQKLLGAKPGKSSRDPKEKGILTETRTQKVIAKWRSMGLVETRKIIGDEPIYVWLTVKGLRTVGLDYRENAPSLATVKHYHIVNIVRLYLESKNPSWKWKSERSIRGEVETMDTKERKGKHVPDGIMIPQTAQEYAVEIELNRKSKDRLLSITTRLNRDFISVYYFTNGTAIKEAVQDATKAYAYKDNEGNPDPKKDKFQIRDLVKVFEEVNLHG